MCPTFFYTICQQKTSIFFTQFTLTQDKWSNEKKYLKYKYDINHLLIGVLSDAVAGWLKLASFFYVHERYLIAQDLINYVLSKIKDKKCENKFKSAVNLMSKVILTLKQESAYDIIEKEKLTTALKALSIRSLRFECKSEFIPKELHHDVETSCVYFLPFTYAYFLRFLCCYHLHDIMSCKDAMKPSLETFHELLSSTESFPAIFVHSSMFVGIAGQMIGETYLANECFKFAKQYDNRNLTSVSNRWVN